MRLETLHLTQQAFRATMDAMARPGCLRQIPALATVGLSNPYLAILAIMLLDSNCQFAVASADNLAFATALARQTYAQLMVGEEAEVLSGGKDCCAEPASGGSGDATAPAGSAADCCTAAARATFALVTRDAQETEARELIVNLSGGTLASPEWGATLLLECDALATIRQPATSCCYTLAGPGVNGQQSFTASSSFWFEAREQRADEFPCGIDIILVDVVGNIVGLPRSSRVYREAPINSLPAISRLICPSSAREHNAITSSSGLALPNRPGANQTQSGRQAINRYLPREA